MADLIDRQAAIKALREQISRCPLSFYWGLDKAMGTVDRLPAVEVVRCGECKHYEDHKRRVYENCVRDGRQFPMKPDDFCSYGVRREENAAR